MAYRHDSDFPGFRELNKIGTVITDMTFLSTTREASTLQQVAGSGQPEILSVIKSKTGRFIKPGAYNNTILSDENEVLLKSGTQFKITKRIGKTVGNNHNGPQKDWTADMDSELKKAVDQDIEKARVKMIVKKEEV